MQKEWTPSTEALSATIPAVGLMKSEGIVVQDRD